MLTSSVARRAGRVAGAAWLLGVGLLVANLLPSLLAFDVAPLAIGMLLYGAWALILGARLLWRPSRGWLVASCAFAVVQLMLYAPLLLANPLLLALNPDTVAGAASAVALVVEWRSRKRRES